MTIVRHILTQPVTGNPIVGMSIPIRLASPGFVAGEQAEVTSTSYTRTDTTGQYSIDLRPQSQIEPSGTHYTVSHPGREMLSFAVPDGEGPFWLYDLLVEDPAAPSPVLVGVTSAELDVATSTAQQAAITAAAADAAAKVAAQATVDSNTYARPDSRSASLQLSQQAPLGGVRVDPFQVRADNATTACVTPTPDGGGQVVEPCVIHFPLGWNGFEYWAVMSSYPNADGTKENPSILCSHDGDTWQVPPGATNPIDAPTSGAGYVDGTLVMDGDTMWCVYNTGPFYAKSSTDGVTWSSRITLSLTGDTTGTDTTVKIGPMLARRGDNYYLWYNTRAGVSGVANILKCYMSTTGIDGTFNYVGDGTFTPITGRDLWERNVVLVGDQFVAVWGMCLADTGGADCKQHLAVSTDGIAWTLNPSPLLDRGAPTAIDNNAIYRSTIVPLDGRNGQLFDLWYGAVYTPDGTTYTFRVARTVITYDPPIRRGAWQRAPRLIGVHYPPSTYAGSTSTIPIAYQHLVAAPAWTDETISIDQLAVAVSAAAAGAVLRMGIYLPTYPQRPFPTPFIPSPSVTLLVDAGTVDASTTGLKTLTLGSPVQVPAGLFWLVGVTQGATTPPVEVYCIGGVTVMPAFSPLGLSQGGMNSYAIVAMKGTALVAGALPATTALSQTQGWDMGVTYRRSG